MKVLIFGHNGQDGYYLKEIYKNRGYEIYGISRNWSYFGANKHLDYMTGDISDRKKVTYIIKELTPDIIINLAATSATGPELVREHHDTIVTGTLNILEAVKQYTKDAKIFITGSGLQFVNTNKPIKETDRFEANNSYSYARIASVELARFYRTQGVRTYVGYLFNHDSSFRRSNMISQKILSATRNIKHNKPALLEINAPEVVREWGYAREISEAISLLLDQDKTFEAVIGTGVGHPISKWVQECFNYYDIKTDWKEYLRKSDYVPQYKALVSNPSTMKHLGWEHKTDISGLVKLMAEKSE